MIKEIDIKSFNVKLKATIQATGRLGFTNETKEVLNLSEETYIKFARDDEGEKDFYMTLVREPNDNAFKVMKSGIYYYLSTQLMFDALGINYREKNIMFDLVRRADLDILLNGTVYRMCMRTSNRNKNNNEMKS